MRIRWTIRAVLLVALILITWVALTPQPPESTNLFGWDKANHCAAFFVLALLADYATSRKAYLPWLGLVIYGIGIEFVQGWFGYRFFEISDIIADTIGIVIYAGLSPLGRKISLLAALKDVSQ